MSYFNWMKKRGTHRHVRRRAAAPLLHVTLGGDVEAWDANDRGLVSTCASVFAYFIVIVSFINFLVFPYDNDNNIYRYRYRYRHRRFYGLIVSKCCLCRYPALIRILAGKHYTLVQGIVDGDIPFVWYVVESHNCRILFSEFDAS